MTQTIDTADRIAVGLAAGLVGTALMTLSQKAEMALTGRPESTTPAKAVEQVSGVALKDETAEKRASVPVHWAYGTALGTALAGLEPLPTAARTPAFFGLAWGSGAALLSRLRLAKPPADQDGRELAIDLGHHLVYATGASLAYALGTRWLAQRRAAAA
ncbi:hypothetical protein HMF7854_06230 [Sphingomonas ginkgonis]|uniref:DUF1440 domain-containing protein n=1 Tax=Sphingomonas ginkgonis TaxID=2315330 RepID=A0A429V9B5_9SPHN|nr:hypothetical protein [Sphingomonas ginkgonis]RST30472.1 hypothetical protein HMF7854_06230 [Sphingomonas ginkgonis]